MPSLCCSGSTPCRGRAGKGEPHGLEGPARLTNSMFGRPLGVVLIVLEKSISAIAVGLGAALALVLRARGMDNPLALLFPGEFAEHPQDAPVQWVSGHLPHLGQALLIWLAVGLVVWAIVLALEAYGVWFHHPWGELLLIVESCLFVPAEFVGIMHHPSLESLASLVVNAVILLYVVRLYRRRSGERMVEHHLVQSPGD